MKHPAALYRKEEGDRASCFLCAHGCRISPGAYGICSVRKNIEGRLYTFSYGALTAMSMDPIEKKPFYHFMPGSYAYSIAAPGCNFKCGFCQNWQISQLVSPGESLEDIPYVAPETVVENALENGARVLAYTYTEPTIFFEYALDCCRKAKENGLKNVFVTNGYMSVEALNLISPYLDGANVDLKFFSDELYRRECGGRLEPVLNTIKEMKNKGTWVEITTLIIPGRNDSEVELKQIADFICSVDKDIPWHISRFYPQYRYDGVEPTPLAVMEKAEEIGRRAGLEFVYQGNTGVAAETACSSCGAPQIRRAVYSLERLLVDEEGRCSQCGRKIPGVWR